MEEEEGRHSGFIKVRCPDCSNEQVLFWRTNTMVNCETVSYTHLTLPTTPYV